MRLSLAMKSCFMLSLLMKLEMPWIPDQVAKQRKGAIVRLKWEPGVLLPWYVATAIFLGQLCGSGGINSPQPLQSPMVEEHPNQLTKCKKGPKERRHRESCVRVRDSATHFGGRGWPAP